MTENRRIARAAGLVSVLTVLSRIAGLARDAVVGYYFGTGIAADAFFVAFRIPNLLRRFVAEGAMSAAFVPVFTDYLTHRSRAAATQAVAALAGVVSVALLGLTLIGVAFAPAWTTVFAPGFADQAGKFALTVSLTRWMFPYIFLVSLVALSAGVLNALRHFTAPALSPFFLNLAIIAAALLFCPRLQVPVYGLAYGVLIGGILQLAIQVPPLLRYGVPLLPRWQPRHEAVRRTLRLMGPMLFGAAVYQINLVISTMLASVLPSGSVSFLWYAGRVFEFPLGVVAVALGTAVLPSFSAQAVRGAHAELRHSLSFAVRLTSSIVLPATVGLLVLATPIVSVLFERGAFGPAEVRSTAQALCAFALGLWPVSMARLVVPAFYAMEDAGTPVLTAAGAFVANCAFSVALMGPVAATGESRLADAIAAVTQAVAFGDLRHAGLALATSLSAAVNLMLLWVALRRRLGALDEYAIAMSFLRSAAASLAMIPAVRWVAALADWTHPGALPLRAAVLVLAMAVGVAVFAGVALLLGGAEVRAVIRQIRARASAHPSTGER